MLTVDAFCVTAPGLCCAHIAVVGAGRGDVQRQRGGENYMYMAPQRNILGKFQSRQSLSNQPHHHLRFK